MLVGAPLIVNGLSSPGPLRVVEELGVGDAYVVDGDGLGDDDVVDGDGLGLLLELELVDELGVVAA